MPATRRYARRSPCTQKIHSQVFPSTNTPNCGTSIILSVRFHSFGIDKFMVIA